MAGDPLADQAALHVDHADHDGVDRAGGDVVAQGVEIEIAGHRGYPRYCCNGSLWRRPGQGASRMIASASALARTGMLSSSQNSSGVWARAPIGPVPQRVGAPIAEV